MYIHDVAYDELVMAMTASSNTKLYLDVPFCTSTTLYLVIDSHGIVSQYNATS